MDRSDRAVEAGLEYLAHLGVHWSAHPAREEVEREYADFRERLADRAIEDLIDLPPMTDPASLATMEVLSNLMAPALFTDRDLYARVTCRAVNLSLEHGNCHGSCFAYLWMGPCFGDYREGFRFARLSLDLVESRGLDRFKPRVYLHFGNIVNHWTRPFHAGRKWIQRGFEAANENGDLTFVAYGCNHMVSNLIASGEPLDEVQREAEKRLGLARTTRFGLVVDIITAQRQLIRALRGLTERIDRFDDAEFDERRFERHLEEDPRLTIATCWYWLRKLQARVFAGDHDNALVAADKAGRLLWTCPWHIEFAEYHFYAAVACAGRLTDARPDERRRAPAALAEHHRLLGEWASNSPENDTGRAASIGAEIARVEGRTLDAEALYEVAIHSARTQGLLHDAALACELTARFYRDRGFETIAHAYLKEAHHLYSRWGADGKTRQLETRHPRLLEDRIPGWMKAPIEDLDLLSLAKSADAISEELVLGKLVGMLMRITVESAGAERGLLVLLDDRTPRIEAEALVRGGNVEVDHRQAELTGDAVPMSVVQFTMRTRERVIVDDAAVRNAYSDDAYIRRRQPRSVLCLPIVKQTKLMGVLYLENNLAPDVFTASRVSMLNLLASRAAISLENARLYADLERENAERKRVEQELLSSDRLMREGQRIGRTGSWSWHLRTGRLIWSTEQKRIFGFASDRDVSFRDFALAIHAEDREAAVRTVEQAAAAGQPFDHAFRIVLPDRAVRFVRGSGRPVVDPSGEVVEYFGATADVTEQRRTESELEAALAKVSRSEDQLRTLIDRIPCHAWTADAEGRGEFFSQRWLDYAAMTSDEARGAGWAQAIHPDDVGPMIDAWRRIVASKCAAELEARFRRHDGTYRWYLFRAAPVLGEAGEIVKWYGTNVDIDELKRAETLLAGEKRLFEMIAVGEPIAATLGALCEVLEELVEGTVASVVLQDEDEELGLPSTDGLRACGTFPMLSTERAVLGTLSLFSRDGRDRAPEESRIAERFAQLAGIVVERKRAEETLRKSEALLAESQRIAHFGYWERDLETGLVTGSEETCRIFGLQLKDGLPYRSRLEASIHPEDRHVVAGAIDKGIRGGARHDVEYRLVRPDGEVRFVRSMGEVVQDGSGRSRRMFGTVQDITERKHAEEELRRSESALQKVQADLAHVTRVMTMGELAASIAHEVSQPLTAIATNAEVGLQWLAAEPANLASARTAIQRVIRDGNRAAEVIARIRKLFRKEAAHKEALDVNEVIREVIGLTRDAIRKNRVDLRLQLAADLPQVLGDRVQIQQVLMNLSLNAVDAMSSIEGRPRKLCIGTTLDDTGKVCVDVRDTGVGIDEDSAERIFEPFHTSKPGGMGMGLSICRTIVEDHGGSLRLVPGATPGARFRFTLARVAVPRGP